ncbi:MAG: hypothetical protein A2147_07710 [Chloroflexi bacterium RBG_16_57_8]|nr:MAG: hypothetical protein A2147_07710 [Chloroflexi bacterium RBG_16_57_8]
MPCLIMWEKLDDDLISYVGFDNFRASFMMTEYLVSLNHRRIGLICGPFSKVGRVRARMDGYRAALAAHAIPFDPDLVVEKEPTLVDGREAMRRLLAMPENPTAVFAASDILAIGALAGVKDKGMRVPEHVSLAGFDDIDFAAYCSPPLTTVRVPSREIGQLAVKVLIEMMKDGPIPARQYCLDTDLVVRSSCAPLAPQSGKSVTFPGRSPPS